MSEPRSPDGARRSVGLAVTSVALSVAAYCGLTLLTAIPGIIMGHMAVRWAREEPENYGGRAIAWAGIFLGYLNVLLICVAVGFLVYQAVTAPVRGPGVPRASCQNNLKQLGIVMEMFANESKGQVFPLLSSTRGELMFEAFEIYPEYVTDPNVLCCPDTGINYSQPTGANIDDHSYYYLGYVITCDDEAEAFAGAYRKRLSEGLPFDQDLLAPDGTGSAGGNVFYRLREGVGLMLGPMLSGERLMSTNFAPQRIPVMIERPGHHGAAGSSVLYMDGHVERVPFGTWPVTERAIQALERMDALGEMP